MNSGFRLTGPVSTVLEYRGDRSYLLKRVNEVVHSEAGAQGLIVWSAFVRHLDNTAAETWIIVSSVSYHRQEIIPFGPLKLYSAIFVSGYSSVAGRHSQDGNRLA